MLLKFGIGLTMQNKEQLLEAYRSTLKYYERKLADASTDYDKMRWQRKCSELDVKIYDLETTINE